MKWKKILAIGAHPDDIEYGCYGLLAHYRKTSDLYFYVCSLGSAGDPSSGPLRLKESNHALSTLKPKKIIFNETIGLHSKNYETISNDLYALVQKIQPDLILTHSPNDTHQEHRMVYELTMTAARRSNCSILRYGILSNTLDFSPRFFQDITKYYTQKKAALKKHRSQAKKYYMSDAYLKIFHEHHYVNLNGISFSESYEVERIFS